MGKCLAASCIGRACGAVRLGVGFLLFDNAKVAVIFYSANLFGGNFENIFGDSIKVAVIIGFKTMDKQGLSHLKSEDNSSPPGLHLDLESRTKKFQIEERRITTSAGRPQGHEPPPPLS